MSITQRSLNTIRNVEVRLSSAAVRQYKRRRRLHDKLLMGATTGDKVLDAVLLWHTLDDHRSFEGYRERATDLSKLLSDLDAAIASKALFIRCNHSVGDLWDSIELSLHILMAYELPKAAPWSLKLHVAEEPRCGQLRIDEDGSAEMVDPNSELSRIRRFKLSMEHIVSLTHLGHCNTKTDGDAVFTRSNHYYALGNVDRLKNWTTFVEHNHGQHLQQLFDKLNT